jgi:rare lipoprotein A
MNFRQNLLLALIGALAACSTGPGTTVDSKPTYEVGPDAIAEAVPRAENIRAAGNTSPYRINNKEYRVLPTAAGYREQGRASWYGRKFHGRATANGETYNMYAPTAAHRSLPIPSYVRVTNLDNGRSMVLRVNDRGPFHGDRIIDLSYGAAVKLGFVDHGTAPVEVVALDVPGSEDLRGKKSIASWQRDYRYLQVASFSDQSYAVQLRQSLEVHTPEPIVVKEVRVGSGAWYRVSIGPVEDPTRLLALQDELEALGYNDTRMMPE